MPKSSPYLQRSLVLDSGHWLVQVPRRSGGLWKRIAHEEFGVISRTRCCWNSQKAGVQFPVQQLHCPGVSSKAKDTENCLYILLRIIKQLRLFRIIVVVSQLSLHGADANMCEEFESHQDRTGQPDVLIVQSIVLSEIKAEVPLKNDIPSHQNLLLQRYGERIKCFHQKAKWVNSVWKQDSYMLLKLDSISWLKTLKNSSLRGLVVKTLFQEVTNRHNQKDGFRETQELDPYWNGELSIRQIWNWNQNLVSERRQTLNPGTEFLMDQINSWLIRTTTTQKFMQIYLKNKLQLRRILQPDRRRKQKPQERTCWFTEHHSNEWKKVDWYWTRRFFSLCVRDFEESDQSSSTLSDSTRWQSHRGWRQMGIWSCWLQDGKRKWYMMKMGLFVVVDVKECYDNGCKPLMLKWVDKMKCEKCRSRLVCPEIKKARDRDEQLGPEDLFSPMPPSEVLKMFVSTMMTGHDDGNHVDGPFEMSMWDVSRAQVYGEASRWIHTLLPEGHEQVGKLARLCRSIFRWIWETHGQMCWESSMIVGTACPAFFCSCHGDLKGLCHGDDFFVVARQKQLQAFGKVLEKRYEVKHTGHIGFGVNDKEEVRSWIEQSKLMCWMIRWRWRPTRNLLRMPWRAWSWKVRKALIHQVSGELKSNKHRLRIPRNSRQWSRLCTAAWWWSWRMLLKTELTLLKQWNASRDTSKEPLSGHMQELERLGRYLVKNRKCVLTCARQTSDETLQVRVDSDWAGDLLGRKSTTGVIVRRGEHLLRHMSCLQTLVALSSGGAEYYALIRGACTSLIIQSHYQYLMIDVPIQIYSDSSAARSVARRRGIGGRLRHLQTRHLWLQSRVARGHLKLNVVACEKNPADKLTKTIAWTQNPRRNILVKDGCSNNNNNKWLRKSRWMLGDEHLDGLTHSQQTDQDLCKAFSSYSSLSSSSSRNGWERAESIEPVNAERQRSGVRSKGVKYSNSAWFSRRTNLEDESNEFENECVKSGKIRSKSMVGRLQVWDGRCAILEPMMRECGAWVRDAKHLQHLISIEKLVETRKLSCWMSKRMTTSSTRRCGRVETSATAQRDWSTSREAGGRNWKLSRSFPRIIFDHIAIC